MIKYLILLCAFISLTANAQSVSESEAFQKAQKFLFDKKLKTPRGTTRGEEVYNPYYIFNAEDGNGCVIISGDERLPEVLAYSENQSIDSDNIPELLKVLIPLLSGEKGVNIYDYNLIPSEYVPRNTSVIEPLINYPWNQRYPFNQFCPIIHPDEEKEEKQHAYVGCTPLAFAQVMGYFKYPKSTEGFEAKLPIEMPGENGCTHYPTYVPYTEFKWDLIRRGEYSYTSIAGNKTWKFTDEEGKAVAELCYHVGLALKTGYRQTVSVTNCNQRFVNWEDLMKNLYQYEEAEFIRGHKEVKENGEEVYHELPDEQFWNFLDKYLERGIPVVGGGGNHSYVISGRDDRGMYYNTELDIYMILQPSLWQKLGTYGSLVKYNNCLNLFAFVPPKEYIPERKATAIINTKVENSGDGSVYNLQGRKIGNTLEGLPKGVYIKDGKKYLIK